MPEFCVQGDGADIVLIEVPTLRERKRLQIERFRANAALAVKDGWIVVGDGRGDCSRETHAAAYAVGNDGSVAPLWRDASPFNTSGRGIRRSAGTIEIVGYAQRSVAIRQEAPAVTAPDFSAKRLGNEAYVSGEVFSVRLSDQGQEERRDFVARGLPGHSHGDGLGGRAQRDLRHGRLAAALDEALAPVPIKRHRTAGLQARSWLGARHSSGAHGLCVIHEDAPRSGALPAKTKRHDMSRHRRHGTSPILLKETPTRLPPATT